MIIKTAKYTDFNGNERTEELHFNLTQTEIVELATELPKEMADLISSNPDTIDEQTAVEMLGKLGNREILEFIKKIVLKSYGVKSADGRTFKKSEELTAEFSQTLAFDNLIIDLMSNDTAASDFINGVIPAKLVDQIAKGPAALPTKQ